MKQSKPTKPKKPTKNAPKQKPTLKEKSKAPKKTLLETRIDQFKAEVGKYRLTPEQQKLYLAFTRTEGRRNVSFSVVDCEGIHFDIIIDTDQEVKKILTKHYKGRVGTVTAMEILRMFDIVREGSKTKSGGNVVYKKKIRVGKNSHFTVVKFAIDGRKAWLKSFYSDIMK